MKKIIILASGLILSISLVIANIDINTYTGHKENYYSTYNGIPEQEE